MVRHWLLSKAVELPKVPVANAAFGAKTEAAPGDDDDIDFASDARGAYATKTNAAPGDDDDVDFTQSLQPSYLAKTAGPLPSDDDDVDFRESTFLARRVLMTKTMAAPGDDDDLD